MWFYIPTWTSEWAQQVSKSKGSDWCASVCQTTQKYLHQTGLFLTTLFIQQRLFLLFCREKMIQAYEFAIEKIGLDYSSYPVSVFFSQAKFLQFLNSPSSKCWIFQNPLLPKFSIGNRRCRYIAYILTYFLFEHLKNSPFYFRFL